MALINFTSDLIIVIKYLKTKQITGRQIVGTWHKTDSFSLLHLLPAVYSRREVDMPRQSVTIQINGSALRDLIQKRQPQIQVAAEKIGVSRQALHDWITSEKIPPVRLSMLARKFSLSAAELEQLKPKRNLQVMFRTLRRVTVAEETRMKVTEVAKDFLMLDAVAPDVREDISIKLTTDNPQVMAEHILRELKLSPHPLALGQVLLSLNNLNIPVAFFPFEESLRQAKIKAFLAKEEKKRVIFIDSKLAWEDVLWNLFHELAHVFAGHDDTVTKKDEEFCDSVASDAVTPQSFFSKNEKQLRHAFASTELRHAKYLVDEIANQLGASFSGVILALKGNKIIESDSAVLKYLYKIHHNTEANRIKVIDLITPSDKSNAEAWIKLFNDPSKIPLLKLPLLIKQGLLAGQVSVSRAAEILDIDVMTMQELVSYWNKEDEEATFADGHLRGPKTARD